MAMFDASSSVEAAAPPPSDMVTSEMIKICGKSCPASLGGPAGGKVTAKDTKESRFGSDSQANLDVRKHLSNLLVLKGKKPK